MGGGGFGRFLGDHNVLRGNCEGISSFQQSFKGGGRNRKLTASEGKGIMRILQSLTGRSSEFYHDATKILVPPPPLTLPLCP